MGEGNDRIRQSPGEGTIREDRRSGGQDFNRGEKQDLVIFGGMILMIVAGGMVFVRMMIILAPMAVGSNPCLRMRVVPKMEPGV